MIHFNLETALLLLAAYFIGAIIGCWLRKLFKKPSVARSVADGGLTAEPAVAVAGAAAAGVAATAATTQFRGTDAGEASIEIKRTKTNEVDTVTVASVEAKAEPAPETVVERELITIHEPEPAPIEVEVPAVEIAQVETESVPVAAVTATAATAAAAVSLAKENTATKVTPVTEQIDDLTRIKGVGRPVALELKKLGVTKFEHVASWKEEDIARISNELGFTGRIERENWMDQARILAQGDELEFSTEQVDKAVQVSSQAATTTTQTTSIETVETTITGTGSTTATVAGVAGAAALAAGGLAASAGTPVEAAPAIGDVTGGDDLRLIKGVGTNLDSSLKQMGYMTFRQIAEWTPADVAHVSQHLSIPGRIEREKWIEQARELAGI